MKFNIITAFFFILTVTSMVYPQQNDSTYYYSNNDELYTPLSLVFSKINTEHDKLLAADSVYSKLPVKEKSWFKKDYIYIVGTAAVAAIIYFFLPEDKAAVQKKFTFGTPPLPQNR